MRFKIDENLPLDVSGLIRNSGFDAEHVYEERLGGAFDRNLYKICVDENRILVTLDIDFSDPVKYPPSACPGIIVCRYRSQSKRHILLQINNLVEKLRLESPHRKLWIVDESRLRTY